MRCPILPVGENVTMTLPADPEFVKQLQEALVRAGQPVPVNGTYGPETARAIRAFQDAHPDRTGVDRALETMDPRFRYASCATYVALGLDCTSVFCSPAIWGPIVGDPQRAFALCAAVAAAADRGLIQLSCPLPSRPPPRPGISWVVATAVTLGVLLGVPVLVRSVRRRR